MKLKNIIKEARAQSGWRGAKATGAGRQKRHQQWMKALSDEIERLNPKMAGRIDWDTAQYLMNTGVKPKEAAKRMAKK